MRKKIIQRLIISAPLLFAAKREDKKLRLILLVEFNVSSFLYGFYMFLLTIALAISHDR